MTEHIAAPHVYLTAEEYVACSRATGQVFVGGKVWDMEHLDIFFAFMGPDIFEEYLEQCQESDLALLGILLGLPLNETDKAALADRYKDCFVFVALERADERGDLNAFRQILKGGGHDREEILRMHVDKTRSVFEWNLLDLLDHEDEVDAAIAGVDDD